MSPVDAGRFAVALLADARIAGMDSASERSFMDAVGKFFDLLKASGWQTGMLSCGAWMFIWAVGAGHIPAVDAGWLAAAYAFAIGAAMLCLAAVGSKLQHCSSMAVNLMRSAWARRQAKRRFEAHIPFLSDRERQILGYLRHYRLKTFETDDDAGYAAGLLASGYIYHFGQKGQVVDLTRVPTIVPDYVWEVMEAHPNQFPHIPEYSEDSRFSRTKVEMQPWRIPWALR